MPEQNTVSAQNTGDPFAGRSAIVTGGASGIGAALVRALAARRAVVTIADLDEARAKVVADEVNSGGSGSASVVTLDVRDSAAVAELVHQVAADHGQLDMIFNNAGIAVGGMAEELSLEHWDRVIDINLRGVIHGVHAAYPVMLNQGQGHIINPASLAGLVPGPGLAPYDAAKHAVVGLSLSLRAEGASRGVKVSAICPGFVDTPLLDRVNPDLPQTKTSLDTRMLASQLGKLYQAEALAQDVLRAVAKNKALIVAPRSARVAWRVTRYAPNLAMRTAVAGVRRGLDSAG